jgi:EAL domain-containing protein (putative c-di-GMP-specific phosphodiesterase class I)
MERRSGSSRAGANRVCADGGNARHANTLEKLRHLGTKIAIGYSSLKYLTQYQVNRLKLAPEFVFHVTIDYRKAAVVSAAVRLANELGLEVIAEGVETEAQARFISAGRCLRPKPPNCCAPGGSSPKPVPCAG